MLTMAAPRGRVRIRRLALAVLAGLALGLTIDVIRSGGLDPWLARRGLPPPYLPLGRQIEVDGRSIYLDCRGAGRLTVVLEAGSGSDSATWSAVLEPLGRMTRTCAYDRPGRGRSEPGERHTLADAAVTLERLLASAGEPPPYVLVGHSLGGDYARVFAATYPDLVRGVVLVDSFDPELQAAWIQPLLGPLQGEYDQGLDGLRRVVSVVDQLDWPASEAQLRAGSMAGLPVEVLRAARREPRLDQAANDRIAAAWMAAYYSLSPGMVRYTIVWAGHQIQIERPDTVIEAVGRILALPAGR